MPLCQHPLLAPGREQGTTSARSPSPGLRGADTHRTPTDRAWGGTGAPTSASRSGHAPRFLLSLPFPASPSPPSRFPSEPCPSCPSQQGRHVPSAQPAVCFSISLPVLHSPCLWLPPLRLSRDRRAPLAGWRPGLAKANSTRGGGGGRPRPEQAKGRVHQRTLPTLRGGEVPSPRFPNAPGWLRAAGAWQATGVGGNPWLSRARDAERLLGGPSTPCAIPPAGLGWGLIFTGCGRPRESGSRAGVLLQAI